MTDPFDDTAVCETRRSVRIVQTWWNWRGIVRGIGMILLMVMKKGVFAIVVVVLNDRLPAA